MLCILSVFSVRVFSVRVFSVRVVSEGVFRVRVFSVRVFSVSVFSVRVLVFSVLSIECSVFYNDIIKECQQVCCVIILDKQQVKPGARVHIIA